MKDEILFAIYKDEAIFNKKEFKKDMKKYKKDANLDNLYVRIVNYQIDTYGYTLSGYDPTFFEQRSKFGKDPRNAKLGEYRKANK